MKCYEQIRERTVGVLGGMGPEATVDFLAKLLAATPAGKDQDHIHLIIDHNPKIPDRHASIAGAAPSIGPLLATMAAGLESAGAHFLVMPCNTAHAYAADIRAAVGIPLVSMIDVAVEHLQGLSCRRVGVMAARGCLEAGLFQQALSDAGLEAVLWHEAELRHFMELLYRIKAGDRAPDIAAGCRRLAAELEFQGAEVLLAGCTELPLVLHRGDTGIPLLSSTDLLVQRTIALARNDS